METKKIQIIGKSDATITMILDILESNKNFLDIHIFNNLNSKIEDEIQNKNFKIGFIDFYENNLPLVLGVFRAKTKKELLKKFNLSFENFITLIHESCQISSTTVIKNGCIINPLVIIAAHSILGNFVSVNRNVSIGHHTIIEDFSSINPGCNIAGNVKIGEGVTIGMGTNILEKIKVGKNTIIGAGSLVTKDLPDNVVAYGVPCKIIRENE